MNTRIQTPSTREKIRPPFASPIKADSRQVRSATIPSTIEFPNVDLINRALQAERTRIGHELHDNVNQILSSAALYLDSLRPVNDQQELIKSKGREYILLAIEEIRNLSRRLTVPAVENKSLAKQIHALIHDIHQTTSMQLSYTSHVKTDRLSSGKQLALFRIIQEQIKNILTHSRATQASIHLRESSDGIELRISDNGVGFDTKKVAKGVGMASILARISQYAGKVHIEADPGKGCSLRVDMPLS